ESGRSVKASTWKRGKVMLLDSSNGGTLLRRRGRPGELVRIAQLQASQVDDLLRVAPEVGQAVEDRRQPGHVEALDGRGRQQLAARLSCQDRPGLAYHRFQPAQQLLFGDRAALCELCGPVPTVRRST